MGDEADEELQRHLAAQAEARRTHYWALQDFSQGHGLEIGPLHRPLVRKDEADVSYVDVTDRAGLVQHYSEEGHGVPVEGIPEIDFALIQPDGHTLSLAEAVKPGAPFDWVVASHVIEHVPDVIGWLDDIAEVVADDGALVLAIPDKRYCFDVHRPLTTVGQMIAAHEAGDLRPTVRAVYDHFSTTVVYDASAIWRGEAPSYARLGHTEEVLRTHLQKAEDGEYVDCHVWLFTPDWFLRQMHELRTGGRSQWYVEQLVPTPQDDIEFRVRMRRVPRHGDAAAEQPGEVRSHLDRPEWVDLQDHRHRAEHAEQRIAVLEQLLEMAEASLVSADRRAGRGAKKLEKLERQIARHDETIARLREQRDKGAARVTRLEARLRRQSTRLAAREAELARLRGSLPVRISRLPGKLRRR